MLNKTKVIVLALSMSLLSACGSLSPVATTPMQTYRLNANVSPMQQGNANHGVIFVSATPASASFNGTAMYYQQKPYQLDSFAKNAWVSPPATMINASIVENLTQLHQFNAVLSVMNPGVSMDYTLSTKLLNLYQDFTSPNSQMVLSIEVTLIDSKHNKVLASQVFNYKETAGNTPYGGVVAANEALGQFLNDLDQWLLAKVQK